MENITFSPILLKERDREKVEALLDVNCLKLESRLDYTIVAERDGLIIATDSLAGPVIRCLATDGDYHGLGRVINQARIASENKLKSTSRLREPN